MASPDDEPGLVVRRLVPPAVEHREIEGAVHRGLHARGAGRLAGPLRRVEPHVAAGHELARETHVVVGQEHDAAAELGAFGRGRDGAQERLSVLVARMGLAGEEELDRPLDLVEEVLESLRLAEEQRRALVGREPAGEADRQRLRIESAPGLGDLVLLRSLLALLLDELLPAGRHQPRPQRLVRLPELAAVDRLGRVSTTPVRAISDAVHVAGCTPLVIGLIGISESGRSGVTPRQSRRDTSAWSLRDRVLVGREPHREDGHREELPAVLPDLAAEVEELVEADAELGRRSRRSTSRAAPA